MIFTLFRIYSKWEVERRNDVSSDGKEEKFMCLFTAMHFGSDRCNQ